MDEPVYQPIQAINSVSLDKYVYYNTVVARGSFSKVYYGFDSQNSSNLIAVKKISTVSLKQSTTDKFKQEIELMSKFNHVNIVKFEAMFQDQNNMYIVTELCQGSLKDIINRQMFEDEVKHYMTQIKDGLEYLYNLQIVHRDLKPENILIVYQNPIAGGLSHKDINVKIADFGFSKHFEEDDVMTQTLCGTPKYLSPEILFDKQNSLVSDLWSLGIIFFQLLFNKLPYGRTKNIIDLMKNIDAMKEVEIPKDTVISKECIDLVRGLLTKDPKERITWEAFFNHPWFKINSIEMDESIIDYSQMLSEVDKSSIHGQLISVLKKREEQPKDDKTKITKGMKIIDDYCDRFTTSTPSVAIRIPISQPVIKRTSGSVLARQPSFGTSPSTDSSMLASFGNLSISPAISTPIVSAYNFISSSIDSLSKKLLG